MFRCVNRVNTTVWSVLSFFGSLGAESDRTLLLHPTDRQTAFGLMQSRLLRALNVLYVTDDTAIMFKAEKRSGVR